MKIYSISERGTGPEIQDRKGGNSKYPTYLFLSRFTRLVIDVEQRRSEASRATIKDRARARARAFPFPVGGCALTATHTLMRACAFARPCVYLYHPRTSRLSLVRDPGTRRRDARRYKFCGGCYRAAGHVFTEGTYTGDVTPPTLLPDAVARDLRPPR